LSLAFKTAAGGAEVVGEGWVVVGDFDGGELGGGVAGAKGAGFKPLPNRFFQKLILCLRPSQLCVFSAFHWQA
jgi:hypothetical protein